MNSFTNRIFEFANWVFYRMQEAVPYRAHHQVLNCFRYGIVAVLAVLGIEICYHGFNITSLICSAHGDEARADDFFFYLRSEAHANEPSSPSHNAIFPASSREVTEKTTSDSIIQSIDPCKLSIVIPSYTTVTYVGFDIRNFYTPVTSANIFAHKTGMIRSMADSYFSKKLVSLLELGCVEQRWSLLSRNEIRAKIELGENVLFIDRDGVVSGWPTLSPGDNSFRLSDDTYFIIYHHLQRYAGTSDVLMKSQP